MKTPEESFVDELNELMRKYGLNIDGNDMSLVKRKLSDAEILTTELGLLVWKDPAQVARLSPIIEEIKKLSPDDIEKLLENFECEVCGGLKVTCCYCCKDPWSEPHEDTDDDLF